MLISVITRHDPERADLLAANIDSLFSQQHEEFEQIIVACSAKEDATDTYGMVQALEDERFHLIFTGDPASEPYAPEQLGLMAAKGDFVCFIAEDWYLDERYLA